VHGLVASPFVAAKHGVMGLATLALEGADKGITANGPVPGLRAHPSCRKADRRSGAGARPAQERVLEDVILQPQAVKRLIEPTEVAGVVSLLLGPGGRAFSGAPVTMDLGWTAR
jgi:3-hydroxybutyrate dehydrogenase